MTRAPYARNSATSKAAAEAVEALAASEGPKGDPASLGQEVERLREEMEAAIEALDSPENNMDIAAKEILKMALAASEPTPGHGEGET